ncbi:ATR-interacting protein isoform X1 [Arapaima gigas]
MRAQLVVNGHQTQAYIAMMELPPNKRLKGETYCAPGANDSFGDDEEFTQDDLDEIDVIASQAFVRDGGPTSIKEEASGFLSSRKPVPQGRRMYDLSGDSTTDTDQSNMAGMSRQHPSKEASACGNSAGKVQLCRRNKDEFYIQLEAQQAELKKKLKEVEEELVMRSGEIRVLRDALRQSRQEKEEQRQAHLQQEQDRAQAQNEKEKVLSKKVQSLQSELHFKEAEINEIKSRLQMSERSNKLLVSPTVRNSPKRTVHQDETGGLGSSPGLIPFLTKEMFSAQLSKRPLAAQRAAHIREDGKEMEKGAIDAKNDDQQADPCSSELHQCQGALLLNLLLQHPLDPSKLGLCHLLCISPDTLPGLLLQHCSISSASSTQFSRCSVEANSFHRTQDGFVQAQSRAMSGLNMLTSQQQLYLQGGDRALGEQTCPGALHLLPLLDYHIGLFCQALEKVDGATATGSLSSSEVTENSLASGVEEFALAALRALSHLVVHSCEVVHALLSPHSLKPEAEREAEGSVRPSKSTEAQHPLLKKLLYLTDPGVAGAACRRDAVLTSSLTVLNGLAERADEELLDRLQCVASSHSVLRCLVADSSLQVLCLTISLLALVAESDEGAALLCSHLDSCPLLRLLHYMTSRPNVSITESQWPQFELEVTLMQCPPHMETLQSMTSVFCMCCQVVRFLTKLLSRKSAAWTPFSDSTCQCCSEVVRTVVLILHRQWLQMKEWEWREGQDAAWSGCGTHLLREALNLLHWIWLNDASFSEHCLDVLHLYDQVVAAVREGFRKIPGLTDIEELALEEMCRPETEEAEDIDAGS